MEALLLWQNVSAPYFACKLLMEASSILLTELASYNSNDFAFVCTGANKCTPVLADSFVLHYLFSGQKYKCLAFQALYVLLCSGPETERLRYPVVKEQHILTVALDTTFLNITLCVGFAVGVLSLLHLSVKKLQQYQFRKLFHFWMECFRFHSPFIFILPSIPDFAVNGSTELVHLVWRK